MSHNCNYIIGFTCFSWCPSVCTYFMLYVHFCLMFFHMLAKSLIFSSRFASFPGVHRCAQKNRCLFNVSLHALSQNHGHRNCVLRFESFTFPRYFAQPWTFHMFKQLSHLFIGLPRSFCLCLMIYQHHQMFTCVNIFFWFVHGCPIDFCCTSNLFLILQYLSTFQNL